MRPIDADAYAAEMKTRQDACQERIDNPTGNIFTDREHWTGVMAAFAEAKLTLSAMPTIGGWISVNEQRPESGKHVLLCCEIRGLYSYKSRYQCIGFYAAKHSIPEGKYPVDAEFYDYDEEEDEYYLQEGWYEVIHNWGEYSSVVIYDFVTHWKPQDELPKEEP